MLAIPGYLELEQSDFQVFEDKVLGAGATAAIYLGFLSVKLSRTFRFSQVAVKVFKGSFSDTSIKYELALLSSLQGRSKHILELVGFTETPSLTIVTKFYESGTLASKIHDETFVYPPIFVRDIAMGLAIGMSQIHQVNVVHYDLKPANILLDADFSPVISDFGMAKVIDNSKHSVRGLEQSDVFGFTPAYCAPELLVRPNDIITEGSKKVDIYAFAITLLELITRKKVWRNKDNDSLEFKDICQLVCRGGRPEVPDASSSEYPLLIKIIQESWKQAPQSRPSFDEIVTSFNS